MSAYNGAHVEQLPSYNASTTSGVVVLEAVMSITSEIVTTISGDIVTVLVTIEE